MKYLAAYALASLSGNAPTKATVEAILKAAGVPVDAARVDALFAELDGKDFEAVCSEGRAKLVGGAPCAGSSVAPAAAGGAAAAAAPAAAEEEEDEDDDMGFGLFD